MRRTINISMSEELYRHLEAERGIGTVSEYIRSLIRREQQRRADYRARPVTATSANDSMVLADALVQLDRLRAILEREDKYED